MARCLLQERRSADVVARIGGEEFALILPETEVDSTRNVAEKIREAISNLSELKRLITVSIGISVLPAAKIETEVMIQQADVALYEAKRRGRNQIFVHSERG